MPNYTNNLGLIKPLPEEFYDVNLRNTNWDKIDGAIGNTGGNPILGEDGVLALSHRSKLLTNEDLNRIVEEGYYRARLTQECLNVPEGITAFGLLVLRVGESMANGGNCTQILVPYGTFGNLFYTRIVTEGVWGNWQRIPVADLYGNLTVGNGLGVLFADNFRSVIEHKNPNGRCGIAVYSNEGLDSRYKVFEEINGEGHEFTIYHSGNLDLSKLGSTGVIPATVE